jgi:hypothetical protein
MFCPSTQEESPAPAYEVTYSFQTPDNGYSTFRVYFRPEELTPTLRSLAPGKKRGAELARYFNVAAWRLPMQAAVVDYRDSRSCAGKYVNSIWTRNDANCQATAKLKTITIPSDYLAVQVYPVSPRPQHATVRTQADRPLDLSAHASGL